MVLGAAGSSRSMSTTWSPRIAPIVVLPSTV
jgi:hypothetical protein